VTDEEEVTREEIQEEWDFIDAIIDTKVMDIARDFLVSKGIFICLNIQSGCKQARSEFVAI
jgi:hypothetical protein